MIVDTLKARAAEAMKNKDSAASAVLRLALGEIQTAEARANRSLSDDEAQAIVRKLVKSNEETMALAGGAQKDALARENDILTGLLPKTMTPEEIVIALAPVAEAIRAAKNDGQATGIGMKHLKTSGAPAQGGDVTVAVKRMRGG
jgi:uncharacterized protein